MRSSLCVLAALGGTCLAVGCVSSSVPPAAKAAQVEQLQCEPGAGAQDLRLLQTTTVLKAEPIYSHVRSGNNNSEERVNGAKLVIRPPDGVTAEHLTRILQCHSARALLGQIDRSQFPDDPYWLPNSWLDIEVKPEDGNFAVMMSAQNIPDNLHVYGRVIAFADAHGAARPQAVP
jgi:hypothetical protein